MNAASALVVALAVPKGIVAGVVLHEATHWVTARLLGRRAQLQMEVPPRVVWELNNDGTVGDRIVAGSPQILGIVAVVVQLLFVGNPFAVFGIPLGIASVMAWCFYTLNGGASDVDGLRGQFHPAEA